MNFDNTLWMGGILPGMTETQIINFFRFYNVFPTGVKFIKDKQKNKNKSYCFISFNSFNEANNVLQYLNGKKIPNSELTFNLNWADYQGSKTSYIGNLNSEVTKEDLFLFFRLKYKSVQNARVIYGNNGVSKGFGFVVFKNENEYYKSLKEMNGANFFGNNIKVREQTKREDNKKKNNFDYDKNVNNNILNKSASIKSNDIIIQNNIINNNNIINFNQNNFNINNNESNNININGFNSINNNFENNNIFSNYQNNKIDINNSESFSKIVEDNLSNPNSNQIINDFINKINSSSFFLNMNKNNKNSKISTAENIQKSYEQKLNYNSPCISKEKVINKENMNKKKNLKLEVLDIIDEITLYKKIHESILKTLSYQKMVLSKAGIKFKSK